MVLRGVTKRGQGRLYDSSKERSRPSESFVDYYGRRVIPPPPTLAKARRRPAAGAELYFADRLDYSLCEEKVDYIKWPSEQQTKRRLILRGSEEERQRPMPKKNASSPQNIHQRRVPVEVLPIYNSENSSTWRSPISTLYPDVHKQRTWISYKDQKPRRGVHFNSNNKLRNYF